MKKKLTVVILFWTLSLVSGSMIMAQNKVVVIPLMEDAPEASSTPAPVPKSGQTTSYAEGDDGDLQKGEASPDPRFTDNGDGTVTDNLTGLIWLKEANCDGTKTWADALTWVNDLYDGCSACGGNANDCGLSDGSSAGDWRLPNVNELRSLIDYGEYLPALPAGHPFSNVQSCYWSSTTSAVYSGNAWTIQLGYGYVNYDNNANAYYVWPVRGGN